MECSANTHLTSPDLKMARAMAHWNLLFGLKFESRDDFLAFYNTVKGTIWKLKRDSSVAIKDDTFLRAYLARVIDAPELQHEVKKLISDSSRTYETILELIHADYRAQETGDTLRNVATANQLTSRRGRGDMDAKDSIERKWVPFPSNDGNMLPSNYYSQFKEWYNNMIVPVEERTNENKAWLKSFKFDFRSPAQKKRDNEKKYQRGNQDGSNYRDYNENYNRDSRGGDRNPNNDRRGRRGELNNYDDNHHDSHSGWSHNGQPSSDPTRGEHSSYNKNTEFEEFQAWKDSRMRASRRGRTEEGELDDTNERRRRVNIFRG